METGPSKSPAGLPVMAYQDYAQVPRRSMEAVLGFGVSICLLPAALFGAVFLMPELGIMILAIGGMAGLALGMAGLKEIQESKGLVYGMPWAVIAICVSLAGWALVLMGIVLAVLVNGLMRY